MATTRVPRKGVWGGKEPPRLGKQSKSVILSFIELETRGEPNDPHRSEWRSQDVYRYPYPYPYPVARRISQHAPDPVEVLRQRSASRGLCKVLHG